MRTLLLCVIALCSQVMSMTAQVTGRIEYPHRADYEDQVVLPVDDKGLVIQSFAKDSKEGKRYFKTEFYSTAMKLISTDSILIDKGMYSIQMWLRVVCFILFCARRMVRL